MAALEAACDQLEQCERTFRDDAEFTAALEGAQGAIARYNAPGNEAAQMMRAAPAMLAALQGLVDAVSADIFTDAPECAESVAAVAALADGARAAIAAATGAPTDETGADCETCAASIETRLLPCDECGATDEGEPETEYLAFCQQPDGQGTIWIDHVSGVTLEDAMQEAREACATDWGCDPADVHCLGLIEGKATVAHWQDIADA
jgi:hypothetical protein